jgi:pyocin large subunit-like protein
LNLEDHFVRHGKDFGAKTAEEYMKKAEDFLKNPPKGTEMKVLQNGEMKLWNQSTRQFAAYLADGTPKTMYIAKSATYFAGRYSGMALMAVGAIVGTFATILTSPSDVE